MIRNEQVILFVLWFSFAVILYAFVLSCFHKNVPNELNTANDRGSRAVESLKFVVVVSRHGNRRLDMTFPNDPYPLNDTAFWPNGVQELTTQGRIQMFKLGEKIRRLYNGFLNENYGKDEFHASSTAMDRALMSAELFTAGLYPIIGVPIAKSITWQPVPIYSNSLDKTEILNENCTTYLLELVKSLAKYLNQNGQKMQSINSYLSSFAGTELKGVEGLTTAYDAFMSEDSEGYKLPDWAKEVYPLPINDLASKLYVTTFAGSDKMTQLVIGPFLSEIVEAMKSKVNGTLVPSRKMLYYSGHDATLITLQATLGIQQNATIGVINPGSAMVYELHQLTNGTFVIQVLYMDGKISSHPVQDPFLLEIPNCGFSCDFHNFINITDKYCITLDYENECKKLH